ncbi:cysteine dioxygenase family protein [Chiayiivirga flava]|uniref:Putative metal-dependent enzyme (Double-stranded beta helix superfamily) n=1 Tax=Chiayiivirga flava TaxID=659595 RepID=A0A7W8D7R2_9GAMM|nr:cysteine dioxygenase family protein [Chiayiivirga flava]MBB5208320.1 putative metal-dependent enzyme (double-stranded beta helix superfamily) [Chiayiivirga flava]
MATPAFPGADKLIAAIDAAVALPDEHAIAHSLRDTLCAMIRDRDVRLPDYIYEPVGDHYARRELYSSDTHGYSVVAMTWGPGQGTQIHDHCGMWCVEGVWHGALEITQYQLLESTDDRARFAAAGSMQAGTGSAGSLIPPHEYHTIRNPSADAIAVSLHIYKGTMKACSVFQPRADGWFERETRHLGLDR